MIQSAVAQRVAVVALYVVAAWVSVALFGQGLALKAYYTINRAQMMDGGGTANTQITAISSTGSKYTLRVANYPHEMVIPAEATYGLGGPDADLSALAVGKAVRLRTWGNVRTSLPPFVLGIELLEDGAAKMLLDYDLAVRRVITAKDQAMNLGEARTKQAAIPIALAIASHLAFVVWLRRRGQRAA